MKCTKCNQEFTDKDKSEVNYREFMGEYSHKVCPGTTCHICGEVIEGNGKRDALMNWQHESCKPVALDPKARKAREARLRDEMAEDRGYNASSWIVK